MIGSEGNVLYMYRKQQLRVVSYCFVVYQLSIYRSITPLNSMLVMHIVCIKVGKPKSRDQSSTTVDECCQLYFRITS